MFAVLKPNFTNNHNHILLLIQKIYFCIHKISIILQSFVNLPLHLMKSFRRFDMLFISFLQYSRVIFFTQTYFIAFSKSLALVVLFSATLFFNIIHKFPMVFRSGLFPGQSRTLIFLVFREEVTILERRRCAPSCMNILQLWTVM